MKQRPRSQWIQALGKLYQRYWLPLLLGIVATGIVFGVWQQLLVQERSHIQQLVRQEATATELEINRELSRRILSLERMASRWQLSDGTPQKLWEADAVNHIEHFYGYQAIEWVDPSFHVRWVVPLQGNEAAQNLDLSREPRRQITLEIARDLHQVILTRTIALAQGGNGFLAAMPLFVQDSAHPSQPERFDGFILGVFRFQSFFDSILKSSPQYQVQVYDHGKLLYSQGTPTAGLQPQTGIVQAYSADWQVQVFPTPVLIAAECSFLPTVVLWGGLTSVWSLVLAICLGQRSQRHVRQARSMNYQLQDEIIHRQQVEASLQASEERWQLALRGNNDGIWDWNAQTNEVFFSSRWKEMLGFEDHEISNHFDEWSNRIHPDDLDWVMHLLQAHFARQTPFYISEHRVQCKDGSYKWILDRGQALWDSAGNVVRMVGSHTDITERKQAELALQESEAKYRDLIEHMNAGFIVHAPDAQILQCNARACEMLGLSMEQMLGKAAIDPTWHFIREDGTVMPVEEYPINRVLSTQSPLENYVVGVDRSTQSRVWVLVTAFPAFDPNHQLQQIVVTFIDISKLKQAETELRETAAVMENALWGISKLDPQGRYLYVNKAYADITGYPPEAMIGMPWTQTVDPDALEQLTTAYQQMVQTGKVEVEAKGVRQDGSSFYKQLVMISADNEQQFGDHYCFMKDISERARLEAERKAAEEALRQSESTLRSFFNSGPMLMGIVELHDNDILHLSDNQTAASFFGTTPAAMQNRFASELGISPFQLQQWIHGYRKAEQTQVPVHFEYAHETPTGQYWLAASICQITNDASQYPRFSYIVEDITQRKQTELALEKELMRSQTLFNTSIDGVVILNHQGDVVQTSPSFAQMLGYTIEETLNLNVADWDAQWTEAQLQEIRENDIIPPVFETRHRRKDGSLYDVEISYSRVELDGEMMHFCICRDITDRKQAEVVLRQSEEKFRMAIDFTHNWEYWQAPDGSFVYVSPSCERVTGYTPDDFIQDPDLIYTVIHPNDRMSFKRHVCDYVSETGFIEFRIITRSGDTRWIAHVCQPIFNAEGEYLGRRASNRDISKRVLLESERQQAEEALRQSEATKQAIIQAIPDLLMRMHADGSRVEFISNSPFNLANPEQSRLGISIYDVLPQELAKLRIHYIQQSRQTQTTQVYEQEILIQATQRYEEVRIVPLLQDDVLVMVRDITEHKRAEIALKMSEERLQLALEASGDGLWDWDLETGKVYLNPYYQEMLGYAPNELVMDGKVWEDMIHPDDKPWVLERLQNHLKDNSAQYSFDYRVRCKSGEWKWIADYGKVVTYDQQGQPLRMIGTHKDISDRKQKELDLRQAMEAAEAANLAKSMFLANMSHELRTPLNVILGFTQVMAHDTSLTPSQQEDLQTIWRSGDHLLSLINDVLDLSKIEAGHFTLETAGFDLIALLHELYTMLIGRAKSKQLQLAFEIDPEVPPYIMADKQKLRQILLNLLSNAIKFTHQGSITLRVNLGEATAQPHHSDCASPDSCVPIQFAVSDTGVGISPEEQDSIFDAFVQAEAGKRSVSGTGLGLTISRKLLELMHGAISVDSLPHVGSTFTVTLPVCPANRSDIQPVQQHSPVVGLAPGQPNRRVLVVDDQRENRLALVRLLTQLGLEIQEAASGQNAIQIWQDWQPDLIWMDIRMPGMDGYEATQQIRALEQEPESIIIALTAQASQTDRTLALAAGCNDYISKPFREETILQKMTEYLGLKYLYTDLNTLTETSTAGAAPFPPAFDLSQLTLLNPSVAPLSATWLSELEDAAICGDDRAIISLTKQLTPELDKLAMHLTELAHQYQFEQILHLIHQIPHLESSS